MTTILILLLLLFGLVAIVWGAASTSQAWASAQTAKAAIEAGRAARAASVGNTVAIIGILVLVVLLLGVTAYALYLRLRLAHVAGAANSGGGRWISGPNARWGKAGPGDHGAQNLPSLDALVQLQMLQTLRAMQGLPLETPALPPADEEEDNLPEGWLP